MELDGIARALANLPSGPLPLEFSVRQISNPIYLGKSHQGEPCLIIRYKSDTTLPAGRTTEALTLDFYPEFLLRDRGTSEVVRAGVLCCRDISLTHVFIVMIDGLIALSRQVSPATITPYRLQQYVEDWQALLALRKVLTFQEQLGLWGELEFINSSGAPDRAIEIWFGPKGNRFDFSGPGIDMDVKTSLRGHRHRFSLDQVQPSPSGADRYVWSIHAIEDPASGRSLAEQVAQLRSSVQNKLEFEKKLCAAGYVHGDAYSARFTRSTDRWVALPHVPRVHSIDCGVTEVVFTADLTDAPVLEPGDVERVTHLLLQ